MRKVKGIPHGRLYVVRSKFLYVLAYFKETQVS